MERNGRNLEAKACQNEHQTEDQTELTLATGNRTGDFRKADVTSVAINKTDTVKQHARRERTQNKVFQSGFCRTNAVTIESCEHIECERLQLEAHIKRQHVGC